MGLQLKSKSTVSAIRQRLRSCDTRPEPLYLRNVQTAPLGIIGWPPSVPSSPTGLMLAARHARLVAAAARLPLVTLGLNFCSISGGMAPGIQVNSLTDRGAPIW